MPRRGDVWEVVPFPCEGCVCDDADRRRYGCGLSGQAGQAKQEYTAGADGLTEPISRTCPYFVSLLPHVADVYRDLQDYKRGALGDVYDLPAPVLDYLRAAEYEQLRWEADRDRKIDQWHRRRSESTAAQRG